VVFTVTGQETHVVMYVSFGMFAALGVWLALYCITHKIRVNGRSIQVRKGIFRKFSIDSYQIDRVDMVITHTGIGEVKALTITAGSRKFSVELLMTVAENHMEGSVAMLAYLTENIDESKIHLTTRNPMNLK
jgi:hypothetical protein